MLALHGRIPVDDPQDVHGKHSSLNVGLRTGVFLFFPTMWNPNYVGRHRLPNDPCRYCEEPLCDSTFHVLTGYSAYGSWTGRCRFPDDCGSLGPEFVYVGGPKP